MVPQPDFTAISQGSSSVFVPLLFQFKYSAMEGAVPGWNLTCGILNIKVCLCLAASWENNETYNFDSCVLRI